jgi:hypothetical protein
MSIAPLKTDSEFVLNAVANRGYVLNKRPLTELCAQLAIRILIPTAVRVMRNLKVLSHMEDGRAPLSLIIPIERT